MVAPIASAEPVAVKRTTPLERTRDLNDTTEYVIYSANNRTLSQQRIECLQSVSNCKRPSPYWYPFPLLSAWRECFDCLRHTPPCYFAEIHNRSMCADCQAYEFQMVIYRLLDWEDPEREMRRLGITSTTSSVSALAAQEVARGTVKPPDEINLVEDVSSLYAEIEHYRETGTLAEPREVTTVEQQFTENAEAN